MNQLALILALSYCLAATASTPTLRGTKDSSERKLQSTVSECTVAAFSAVVGGRANLASKFGVSNTDDAVQAELDRRCAAALSNTSDLSDVIGKGPQFLKNFLDGGTTWNDNWEENGNYVLADDADIIPSAYETAKKTALGAPDGGANAQYDNYFSNFYNGGKECRIGAIECCYTTSRKPVDSPLEDNAEMCALDLTAAAKSNHIARHAFTFYDTHNSDETYCSGFAYDKGTFDEAVKYNTLFHMAMMTNLYEKGYVKNVPGAPMCGCLNQMPIVDNVSCVKPKEGYSISNDGTIGLDLDWEDCGSLATYYSSLNNRTKWEKDYVNDHIVGSGNCNAAAKSFMNERFWVQSEWANMAVGSTASQSSDDHGGSASRAVDGNISGNWRHGTVTHTKNEANPWWQTILENPVDISMVRVYNRSDCCSNRLSGFRLEIYNGDQLQYTYNHPDSTPNYKTEIEFTTPIVGDGVKISLPGKTEPLSLAEVQLLVPIVREDN